MYGHGLNLNEQWVSMLEKVGRVPSFCSCWEHTWYLVDGNSIYLVIPPYLSSLRTSWTVKVIELALELSKIALKCL